MKTIEYSPQGLQGSALAFGFWRLLAWQLDTQALAALVDRLLDLGITTFDHADIYGDYQIEAIFGQVMTPARRQRLQLVTKCGICLETSARPQTRRHCYDTSYEHIVRSAEQSLKNFKTDYLDLLLIHRPDPFMDADDTARAFEDLHRQGKVRYFGVSNHSASQTALLQSRLSLPLQTNQLELSVLEHKHFLDGSLDYCQQHRQRPMAWSPLAGGQLFNSQHPSFARLQPVLARLSQVYEADASQLALAWLLAHPAGIVPVIGTGNLARVEQAIASLSIAMDRQDWFDLYQAADGHDIP